MDDDEPPKWGVCCGLVVNLGPGTVSSGQLGVSRNAICETLCLSEGWWWLLLFSSA